MRVYIYIYVKLLFHYPSDWPFKTFSYHYLPTLTWGNPHEGHLLYSSPPLGDRQAYIDMAADCYSHTLVARYCDMTGMLRIFRLPNFSWWWITTLCPEAWRCVFRSCFSAFWCIQSRRIQGPSSRCLQCQHHSLSLLIVLYVVKYCLSLCLCHIYFYDFLFMLIMSPKAPSES